MKVYRRHIVFSQHKTALLAPTNVTPRKADSGTDGWEAGRSTEQFLKRRQKTSVPAENSPPVDKHMTSYFLTGLSRLLVKFLTVTVGGSILLIQTPATDTIMSCIYPSPSSQAVSLRSILTLSSHLLDLVTSRFSVSHHRGCTNHKFFVT
jgi:hypothetical protein